MKVEGYYVMNKLYKRKESECIGFMPERRSDPLRGNTKSMMKWIHLFFKGIVKDIHSLWIITKHKNLN